MKALQLKNHADNINNLNLDLVELPKPSIKENECLIKVASSGINPSDALATTGYFKHAQTPRTPGRDFAGTIIEGPKHFIGRQVWGTGGAAGISFDGTQAEYIALPLEAIAEIPSNLDIVTAGAQTLPYVTAYYGLVKRAHIQENETVIIVGALGQVGRAAMSICRWKKCKAIALVRGEESVAEAKKLGWNAVNTEDAQLKDKMLAANNGKPINVIFNSVGNIYWNDFMEVLAEFGRIITLGARENTREITINLFNLYRANQDLIGINSVSFDFSENAKMLNELKAGFEAKQLTPLHVEPSAVFSPAQAVKAYQAVMGAASGNRIVIQFSE